MFDTLIRICTKSETRDAYNEVQPIVTPAFKCWAQVTEYGGRENLYASRIVNESETVFTIRWRKGITPSMFIYHAGKVMKIVSVQPEGRNERIHIKAKRLETEEYKYVEHQT